MASGDNTRMWFPEMLEKLKRTWHREMPWSEVITLCESFSMQLTNIRTERGINTVLKRKCDCGHQMHISSKISIRSLLFSLKKINVISEENFKDLDKSWKSYQRKQKLNGYGEVKD